MQTPDFRTINIFRSKRLAGRFDKQSEEVCADSGYGSKQNYAHMIGEGITPYVKYNMFHAEDHKKKGPKRTK